MPRVVLVPGVGLFGIGATARDAAIAADLAENTVRVIADAEAIGQFEALPEDDLFDVEYWSLEQAKLKSASTKPFTGQVAVVTGAGSGIGLATAKAFAAEGAAVAVLDIDKDAAAAAAAGDRRLGSGLRRDGSRKRAGGVRAGRPEVRRRRHRRVECGSSLAGQDRRGSRRGAAPKLRAQFLCAPIGGTGGREHHAEARHRRRSAVQRLQAGHQSRPRFRPVRLAEGRHPGTHAPVRRRLRSAAHSRQRRQCGSRSHRPADGQP